jgi:TDG/mug DNA glycosylase family protein
LIRKIERFGPLLVCFNGLMGYRATIDPEAQLGLQERRLGGAAVFVVPSTSAANAGFTRDERIEWFHRLRAARDALRTGKAAHRPADILEVLRPGDS